MEQSLSGAKKNSQHLGLCIFVEVLGTINPVLSALKVMWMFTMSRYRKGVCKWSWKGVLSICQQSNMIFWIMSVTGCHFLKSALNIDGQKQLFAFKGIVYKTACEMTCK